jgi:predicted  nucleic acid-binding Zn-ribbon protein
VRPAELLAELAEAERRLQALLEEVEAVTRRAGPDAVLEGLVKQRQERELALRQNSSALRQLELEAASLRARATSHERALYDGTVRHPADLQRRQHELDSLRGQMDVLDARQLEQMELVENDEAELGRLDSARQEREQQIAAQRQLDQQLEPAQEEALSSVRGEIDRLTAQLPAAALLTYRRLAKRRQPAVVRVAGGICGGCRLPLPPRILQELRGDQLVTCENCERILLL